jgi:hypothetical protein
MLNTGSYRGTSEGLRFDFRIARSATSGIEGGIEVVSGDITRDGTFVASLICGEPKEQPGSEAISGTCRFRGNAELFEGEYRLECDDRGVGSFWLAVRLQGNYRDVFAGRLERLGPFMRRLTVQVSLLEGTAPPSQDGYLGRSGAVTIARAFREAGFDTEVRVEDVRSMATKAQRMRGYTLAEIHSAMEQLKQPAPADGLLAHVFVCSYLSGRDGRNVLGVMYDFGETDLNRKPREGVAVFYDTPTLSDPRIAEIDRQREYVFTVVHEVGHALNLLHSFDKARPSALSWMNYPHLYPRGYEANSGYNGSSEFWRQFPDSFDKEELHHLHHASPREIAAGGFAFGAYEEGASRPIGGISEPRLTRPGGNPLRAIGGVDLTVSPLKREYHFGEPVFVRVGLKNEGDRALHIPDALDPTDGYLRITFRSPSGRIIPYRPPVKLCRQAQLIQLPPKEEHQAFDGSPVFMSSAGPVFTEPGDYQVTAELTGVDGSRVVYARPSVIRIKVPDAKVESFA